MFTKASVVGSYFNKIERPVTLLNWDYNAIGFPGNIPKSAEQ